MPTTPSTTTASRSKMRLVVTSLEDSAGRDVARATGGPLGFLTAGGYFPIIARFLHPRAAPPPPRGRGRPLDKRRPRGARAKRRAPTAAAHPPRNRPSR